MVSSRSIAVTLGLSLLVFAGVPAKAPQYRAVPVPAGTVMVKGEYLKAFLVAWKNWVPSPADRRLENYDVDFTVDSKYIYVTFVPRFQRDAKGVGRALGAGGTAKVRRSDYKLIDINISM